MPTNDKPKALDLFCCAGGATRGLQMAGFHVTGVDIKPQPRYCGDAFFQADALEFPLDGFDFIWASPPCQAFTLAGLSHRIGGKEYPDLVAAMRDRLTGQSAPWVMENVPGAPLRCDLLLCGSIFGLKLIRHRVFELSFPWGALQPRCQHDPDAVTVCGHGTPSWVLAKRGRNPSIAEKRDAMGIEWTNRDELSQAIPPAYSEFIGRQALQYIEGEAANANQ